MKSIIALLLTLGLLALAGPVVLAAEPTPPFAGPWPGWHGSWPGFWWICPLMMLFMFLLFALVCFTFRRRRGNWGPPWRWVATQPESRGDRGTESESALDILNKRYARGEIDKEEYGEIKAAIVSNEKSPGHT